MKNTRAVVMIIVSVAIGLIAVVLASRWVTQQSSLSTSKVVTAAKDLDLGARLSPEMLTVVEWPRASVPKGAFQDQNMLLKDPTSLEPRVLKSSLQRGEPVLETRLAPVGTKGGLSAVISEGNRAITVRVNDVVGVAGFTLPGNYVDILVNTEDESVKGEGKSKTISKIVLEHILVLAVAQEASRDETKPKVVNAVTLEVTPEQAEKLDLARSVGTLSLVLRNQIDSAKVVTEGANKQNMLNRVEKPEPVKPAEAQKVVEKKVIVYHKTPDKKISGREKVEVIKGIDKSSNEF